MTRASGLYIHIPFCDARCSYCDFVTFVDKGHQAEAYVDALGAEMGRYRGEAIQTLFIGGGTPTTLLPPLIARLFSHVRSAFDLSGLAEATVEANPESASDEKLAAFLEAGVNRISFGLQTMADPILSGVGRLHDAEGFLRAYRRARALGFGNVNVDLIFGLPGQTLESWNDTLRRVAELDPEHVSAYALKVEANTPMGIEGVTVDADLQADMYLAAAEFMAGRGYVHYEISNFAKPGRECRHNRLYWENAPTIGLGVGAASLFGGRRYKNTPRLGEYLKKMETGASTEVEGDALSPDDRARESIMLRLRMNAGIDDSDVARLDRRTADQFVRLGLAERGQGRFRLTPRGWLVSNQLFQHLV